MNISRASEYNEAGAILAEEHVRDLLKSLEWAEHTFGGITDEEKDVCQEKFQKYIFAQPEFF